MQAYKTVVSLDKGAYKFTWWSVGETATEALVRAQTVMSHIFGPGVDVEVELRLDGESIR